MLLRKGLASIAAAVLAVGCSAWASADSITLPMPMDTQAQADASAQNVAAIPAGDLVSHPLFADDAAPPSPPLMMLLEKMGIGKPMEDWEFSITGYVEGSYLYDFTHPHDTTAAKAAPSDLNNFGGAYKNSVDLNQVDLNISRNIDATKGKWDVGGTIEGNYGRDATFFHSNGIYDNTFKHGSGGFAQPDLEQAFLTVAIPLGGGIKLTAGKFVTLLGEETINPTTNAFYSHSYSFSYGIPLTQTGVLGTYYFNSAWNATAGVTRGWNESTSDNNDDPDFLAQVSYTGDKLSVIGNISVGPEGFVGTLPDTNPPGTNPPDPKDNKDIWVVPELIPTYKVSDQLTVSGDFLYGMASSQSQWYGVATYASYAFNSMLTFNVRAEFYHDGHSATVFGGESQLQGGGPSFPDVNYYEVTVGTAITPMPDNAILKNLSIRPEVRYDYASRRALDAFPVTPTPQHGKYSVLTAAVDVFMKY